MGRILSIFAETSIFLLYPEYRQKKKQGVTTAFKLFWILARMNNSLLSLKNGKSFHLIQRKLSNCIVSVLLIE